TALLNAPDIHDTLTKCREAKNVTKIDIIRAFNRYDNHKGSDLFHTDRLLRTQTKASGNPLAHPEPPKEIDGEPHQWEDISVSASQHCSCQYQVSGPAWTTNRNDRPTPISLYDCGTGILWQQAGWQNSVFS
ncbi:hypothetical protein E4U33_005455, partial [Claviceps sp. LM78 group G4]